MNSSNEKNREANAQVAKAFEVCGMSDPNNKCRQVLSASKVTGKKVLVFIDELIKSGFKQHKSYESDEDYTPQLYLKKADVTVHYSLAFGEKSLPSVTWIDYGAIKCTCVCTCGANKNK